MLLLSLGIVAGLAAAGNADPVMPSYGVLTLDFSKFTIGEQSEESNPLNSLMAKEEIKAIGLLDAVNAIDYAAEDPTVQYIYIKSDGAMISVAQAEELRAALESFREKSGKAIVSYIEAPTTGSYYLSSVADKIYMTKHIGATTMLTGVSSQMVFLGDLLEKLGVNVQLIRHGKYKSAGEMFVRGSSSKENREQNQRVVDSIWESMAAQIAESRAISVAELNKSIDGLKLVGPEDFVTCGLVDELMTREELQSKLATLAMEDSFTAVNQIAFADYVTVNTSSEPLYATDQIAVIYANGNIVDGSAKEDVAGDRFAGIIAKVRADSTVKAVVLRVNSPGGSVLAAEKIKSEIDSLQKVKPVVASYGDYAASGGYWISCACDKVYSDATTLTGSIGVFSMIPEFSGLAKDKLHVNVESVSSSSHGDMYGLMRPFNAAELGYLQKTVEDVYERFTSIVSEGREMPVSRVDELGQGRVWTGADAVVNGLADERGSLIDALRYAAELAGDADLDYWVKGYPTPQTPLEAILEKLSGTGSQESISGFALTKSLLDSFRSLKKPAVLARMDREMVVR